MIRTRCTGMALALLAMTALGGCGGKGTSRPPPTNLRVVHAAPSYGSLSFLREAHNEGDLDFGAGAALSFDSGQYDFHFARTLSDGTLEHVANISTTLSPDSDYIFVATQPATGAAIEPIVVESTHFVPTSADAEVTLIHAGTALGAFDVYIEPEGTDLTTATPVGSLAYSESLPPTMVADGAYRVYLTDPGQPANVAFESPTFSLAAARSTALVITNGGGRGTAPITLVAVGDSSVELQPVDQPGAVRVINAIADRIDRDIGVDGQLSPPAFPAVAFGSVSAYQTFASSVHDLNVAPVGNPGAIEHTEAFTIQPGAIQTILVAGDPNDAIVSALTPEDRRSIDGQARFRIFSATNLLGDLEFYLTDPGTDINTAFPVGVLAPPSASVIRALPAGDYELTVRDYDTQTIVAGPQTLTLADGKLYGILAVDSPGGATADIVLFDDF